MLLSKNPCSFILKFLWLHLKISLLITMSITYRAILSTLICLLISMFNLFISILIILILFYSWCFIYLYVLCFLISFHVLSFSVTNRCVFFYKLHSTRIRLNMLTSMPNEDNWTILSNNLAWPSIDVDPFFYNTLKYMSRVLLVCPRKALLTFSEDSAKTKAFRAACNADRCSATAGLSYNPSKAGILSENTDRRSHIPLLHRASAGVVTTLMLNVSHMFLNSLDSDASPLSLNTLFGLSNKLIHH